MSKQTSLANFFKQPLTLNSSSSILNDPDSDVSENKWGPVGPPLKKGKPTTTIFKWKLRRIQVYLFTWKLDLPQ